MGRWAVIGPSVMVCQSVTKVMPKSISKSFPKFTWQILCSAKKLYKVKKEFISSSLA
jgi:hypothetical protein